jgi:hypothetical protein
MLKRKVSIEVGNVKYFRPCDIIRIFVGEETFDTRTEKHVNGRIAYMRRNNYLTIGEDYRKIATTANELSGLRITKGGNHDNFINIFTKEAIYKIAAYLKNSDYKASADNYFKYIESEEPLEEKFDFAPKEKDFTIMNGVLFFSSKCLGTLYGIEKYRMQKFAGSKLVSFSTLLDYISHRRSEEARLGILVKINDYIAASDIPANFKEECYNVINSILSTPSSKKDNVVSIKNEEVVIPEPLKGAAFTPATEQESEMKEQAPEEKAEGTKSLKIILKGGKDIDFNISNDSKVNIKFGEFIEVLIETPAKEKSLFFKNDDIASVSF